MIARECFYKAAKYLGLENLAAQFQKKTESAEDNGLFAEIINDVIFEICTDYYPFKTTVKINADGGVIMLKKLHDRVVDVFEVKQAGIKYPFTLQHNRVELPVSGEVEVTYSYYELITNTDAEFYVPPRISKGVIAYGIASVYCAINGLDDAPVWERKFRGALFNITKRASGRYIKKRLWR